MFWQLEIDIQREQYLSSIFLVIHTAIIAIKNSLQFFLIDIIY